MKIAILMILISVQSLSHKQISLDVSYVPFRCVQNSFWNWFHTSWTLTLCKPWCVTSFLGISSIWRTPLFRLVNTIAVTMFSHYCELHDGTIVPLWHRAFPASSVNYLSAEGRIDENWREHHSMLDTLLLEEKFNSCSSCLKNVVFLLLGTFILSLWFSIESWFMFFSHGYNTADFICDCHDHIYFIF